MAVVPSGWMPKCEMKYIVAHWSAGGHKGSDSDKEHYHIIIEGDGNLVRGDHTIDDNVSTGDKDYAAHCLGFNTKSIGISAASMLGANQSPFNAGSHPMTQVQWERMAEVAADLARFYNIPVDREHVLGHGEVEEVHNKPQKQKWDPMVLPWNTSLKPAQVGEAFREKVRSFMK